MRTMIHAAARLVPVSLTLVALVVEDDGVAGLFIGSARGGVPCGGAAVVGAAHRLAGPAV